MPPQMRVVRQRSDADLFPELKNRPLELIAEAGFQMRNEMQRVNEMNLSDPPHRQRMSRSQRTLSETSFDLHFGHW